MKRNWIYLFLMAIAAFIFLSLASCNQPEPQPAAPEAQINEAGEPLGAAPGAVGINTYCSYYLVRGAGAITTTGATWVNSTAWNAIPAGQTEDRAKFLKDLIATLDRDGVLAGVDLTKTKANWLIVLNAGAGPNYNRKWILDSRDMPLATPVPK